MSDTGKGKDKGKGKDDVEQHRCFHCKVDDAKLRCSQCHLAHYCSEACQKKNWKDHKQTCVKAVAVSAQRSTMLREQVREATKVKNNANGGRGVAEDEGGDGGTDGGTDGSTGTSIGGSDEAMCVICIGPVIEPVELPCGHSYCGSCLEELRAKKVTKTCPLCRADLPPGLEGLFDLSYRIIAKIDGKVKRGEIASWSRETLPPPLLEEIDQAVTMLTEASAQGHVQAQLHLAAMYGEPRGVAQDYDRVFQLHTNMLPAAFSHYNLGVMFTNGLGCELSLERAQEHWDEARKAKKDLAETSIGRKALFDLAFRAFTPIVDSVIKSPNVGGRAFGPTGATVSNEVQKEVDEVVAMLTLVTNVRASARDPVTGEAFGRLASIYQEGWGVQQDSVRAMALIAVAADCGMVENQYNLGIHYRDGIGCERDYALAAFWWEKAVVQKEAQATSQSKAAYVLAMAHNDGQGVERNVERAFELCKKGADWGYARAMYKVASWYLYGVGVTCSYKNARAYMKKATDAGDPEALRGVHNITLMYRHHCPLLGQRVALCGLTDDSLNGQQGHAIDYTYGERFPGHEEDIGQVLIPWVQSSARYIVKLDGPEGRKVKVRKERLEKMPEGGGGRGAGGGDKKVKGKKGKKAR